MNVLNPAEVLFWRLVWLDIGLAVALIIVWVAI
jgi:hypothetical protein